MLPIIRIIGVGKKMGFLGFTRMVIFAILSTVFQLFSCTYKHNFPILKIYVTIVDKLKNLKVICK
jgi:hypothetical protein